ncbi:hypothetical protein EVAR_80779_1 [Eumeta japonica]|uniref:Uncharacterized protein n=1 Tax=Eumeta variegata TaxID=151549 RepID=A0A4C1X986_EUMVA|nr:hypothetical protein EVAR_80779_1 [Eumeta japonica]
MSMNRKDQLKFMFVFTCIASVLGFAFGKFPFLEKYVFSENQCETPPTEKCESKPDPKSEPCPSKKKKK